MRVARSETWTKELVRALEHLVPPATMPMVEEALRTKLEEVAREVERAYHRGYKKAGREKA